MKTLTQYTPDEITELYAARKLNGPSMASLLSGWNDHAKGFRITVDHLDVLDPTYSNPPYVEVVYTAFHGDKIIAQSSYPANGKCSHRTAWTSVKAHTPKGDAVFKLVRDIAFYMSETCEHTLQSRWIL